MQSNKQINQGGWVLMTLTRKQEGFTIVELLIVIIVIGILAGLVIATFTGIQQKARNTERQTDIKTLHGQVEAYFAQNGKYPTLANMNDTAWRSTNMKGLDPDALKDPRGTAQTLVAAPGADVYAYAVVGSDDAACDNSTNDCMKYVFTATYEGGGTYVKNSLN